MCFTVWKSGTAYFLFKITNCALLINNKKWSQVQLPPQSYNSNWHQSKSVAFCNFPNPSIGTTHTNFQPAPIRFVRLKFWSKLPITSVRRLPQLSVIKTRRSLTLADKAAQNSIYRALSIITFGSRAKLFLVILHHHAAWSEDQFNQSRQRIVGQTAGWPFGLHLATDFNWPALFVQCGCTFIIDHGRASILSRPSFATDQTQNEKTVIN